MDSDEAIAKTARLRAEATALAGRTGDLVQRASVYHHLFADSGGNHSFPLLAAHGALWASGYFRAGVRFGSLVARIRRVLGDDADALMRELTAFAEAFRDINRRVCVETFFIYRLGQVNTKTWRGALKRAGISDFRWHDLRHTWASWLRQNDVPTWVLQELGGWKSESMVRRYAHMSVKHLAPYADQLIFEGKAACTNPLGSGPGLRHKSTPSGGSSGLQLLVNNQRK